MNISTGQPSTLGTYREIAVLIGSEDSAGVRFIDKTIAESTKGADEEVIQDESQMLLLIVTINKQEKEHKHIDLPVLEKGTHTVCVILDENQIGGKGSKIYVDGLDPDYDEDGLIKIGTLVYDNKILVVFKYKDILCSITTSLIFAPNRFGEIVGISEKMVGSEKHIIFEIEILER